MKNESEVKELGFSEYGDSDGKTVIYFHGAPGSPAESSLFEAYAKQHDLRLVCYDRFAIDPALQGQAYYQYLADVILSDSQGKPVDFIGFSIGCQAAIQTCVYMGNKVRGVHLISAAAPLDTTDCLNEMAGKMVFSIAMKYPVIFSLLSYWQALLAKFVPSVLGKMLFASATGKDQVLSEEAEFKQYITPILIHCFGTNLKGYIREIRQYVTPWSQVVINCTSSTYVWHGSSDNWSPLGMAYYLKETLPAAQSLEQMDGLSHYSCLYAAAPKICAQLGQG
jgi:pimeloyl-ACP methyl ester carboxylesterase